MIIAIVMIMIHRWEGWVRCILVDTNLNILKTLKITMINNNNAIISQMGEMGMGGGGGGFQAGFQYGIQAGIGK